MLVIEQMAPVEITANMDRLDEWLQEKLSGSITQGSWMTKWESVAQRFQLRKFQEMNESDILNLQWDTDEINSVISSTVHRVNQHLDIERLRVMVVPALPFKFFQDQPQSLWTNAFTNGPGNIILAIPPRPDIDFLQYLLAHEAHHASPENPIYRLSMDTFTLEEWYKMEGFAELFSLSLYPDKRWWKDSFPPDVEKAYWNRCKKHLKTTDDHIKSQLCFGDPKDGIPVFSGYSFALKLAANYISSVQPIGIKEWYQVDPPKMVECYRRSL